MLHHLQRHHGVEGRQIGHLLHAALAIINGQPPGRSMGAGGGKRGRGAV